MFTGIVETLGSIVSIEEQQDCQKFCMQPHKVFPQLILGESIAVNGVCLTVMQLADDGAQFYVTAVPETLRLTNLSNLKQGSLVNLERAMLAETRIGGHYVQGHVDAVGKILEIREDGAVALLVKISLPKQLSKYLIKKGFIALDGMSITSVDVDSDWFTVTFIPHTIAHTVVQHYTLGDTVNIEVDMLAKYVEKLLESRDVR
jgi:riboflavin synthase